MSVSKKLLSFILSFLLAGFLFPQLLHSQDFYNKIQNFSEFRKLSGDPLSAKYGQVDAVKVVYDLQDESLYFVSSAAFEIHFQFCEQVLRYSAGHERFNICNYSTDPVCRQYLLANVNYFRGQKSFVFEISPLDYMPAADIVTMFNKVKTAVFFGEDMRLLLNSSRLEDLQNSNQLKLPVITPLEIFKGQKYQKINARSASGYLRLVIDKSMLARCKPDDILIVKGSMLDIPPVAGIITTELQTPLSHISILSVNRKIPSMAYVDALQDTALLSKVGQYVQLKVSDDGFTVKKVPLKNQKSKRKSTIRLDCDLDADSLVGSNYLSRKSSVFVGNKAAYFGELKKISTKCGFSTPESSFAIPFYFYDQHLRQSHADSLISTLVQDSSLRNNPDTLRSLLKKIRKRIESYPLDAAFLLSVEGRIKKEGSFSRMRFRSSTNAEDMKGFSGAGLYESKTGILGDSVKSIDKAIRKVWASAWNYNAFVERDLFGIDQQSVAMGILVHRSYPAETANGVAITKNIYRPENYGFTLNIQLGEETVVKPSDSLVCEQLICYPRLSNEFFKEKQIVEIISYSSLSPSRLILTEAELLHLANTLDKIKNHFHKALRPGSDYLEFGLDIEFKYDGPKRTLYIDQVRLYND
ncbi:MAG: hypothetical protein IPH88_07120 [Bacteroidales bacterium]|nr:hypothetical protein [Bacteroidales bacterium]